MNEESTYYPRGSILPLLAMWGGLGGYRARPRRDPIEGVDIDTEYELIQAKKSNLTASQRQAVIFRKEGRE